MQINQSSYSSYQSSMVLDRFAMQTMKDSQEITSQSVDKLLSSVAEVSQNVAQYSSRPALAAGVGQSLDVYA